VNQEVDNRLMIFSGNANPELAQRIAELLGTRLGRVSVETFSDGEICVEVIENVRGRDVFILQPTCQPCNDHLMELMVMIDAMRRASVKRVTAVVPYYGYSRQDRKPRSARVPITAKVVANMLASVKLDRLLTVDLHADQIQGFFDLPIDNVYASPILLKDIWQRYQNDLLVVSPDVGGVVRARALAKRLGDAELAIIDKRRPKANVSEVMNIIGDVAGKNCVIVDDLVDTAGTLCKAAGALKDHGAKSVSAYCTHPVLSGNAINNLNESVLDELVVTNTIPLSEEAQKCDRIRQLSVAEMLAETIRRIHMEESVSEMYID
jgi:ribose-phosphate pyrophosphokinase